MDKSKRLPGRPILLGGDDLNVIVLADLAVDYAETLLEAIEERTKDALGTHRQLDGRFLTACAGIAFASASQPFYLMTRLAEELCGYAKRTVKAGLGTDTVVPSAIAFHRVTTSVVADYEDILRDEETDLERRLLTAQPYLVGGCPKAGLPTLASLRDLRKVLGGERLGTTSLRELRQHTLRSPSLAQTTWADCKAEGGEGLSAFCRSARDARRRGQAARRCAGLPVHSVCKARRNRGDPAFRRARVARICGRRGMTWARSFF